MASRMKKEKKDERFSLRCTKSEKTKFEKNAKKKGMSLTDYMSYCVNEYEREVASKECRDSNYLNLVMSVSNLLCHVKNWEIAEGSHEELIDILEKETEKVWDFMNIH